ncbi:MAG TPA: hypothetical protein VKB18_08835 [Gemmatimonadota bacterium]|nr:hypothetical protein [Gemmatimonadota bacterium]
MIERRRIRMSSKGSSGGHAAADPARGAALRVTGAISAPSGRLLLVAALAAALLAGAEGRPARAQQAGGGAGRDTAGAAAARTPALVEQVAGSTLYLRVGTSAGIAAGDTLGVARDSVGEIVGRVSVVAATAERSVVTWAGPAFPVTRGEALWLERGSAPSAAGPARPAAAAGEGARAGEGAARAARTARSRAAAREPGPTGPTASGRVSVAVDLRRSVTTYGGADPVSETRRFATPSLWLQTTVRDLPGGIRLDVSGRVARRLSDPAIVSPETSPEVYEASLDKRFEAVPLELRLGRFYSPFDRLGGYWDGLMLHYGRTLGGGVMVGFEPDRADQAPRTELPKASAFLDYRSAPGAGVGYDGTLSLTAMRPSASSGVADHTFVSLSQRLRAGRWYLTQDARVDRGPSATDWTLTQARLWLSGRVDRTLSVRAGVSRYRPYLYWLSDSVLVSYRRDELSGGFTARFRGGSVGADAGVDRDRGLGTGHSLSGYFSLASLPALGLGLDASGTWFTNGTTRVLTGAAHFSRSLGPARARLGYLLYRSETPRGEWLMSHAVDAGLDAPLARGLYWSLRGDVRLGGGLGQTRVYTSFTKSFGP